MRTPSQPPARHRRAFTLIELIVVIIIIAVLAGIGAVVYNQFVADAHSAANQASATRIREAIDAAAAKADLSPQQEVAALWTAGGGTSQGFLAKLGVSYSGTLTYTAASGSGTGATPATVVLAGKGDGGQEATLTLPDSLSAEAQISYSTGNSGPQCAAAPAPMIGCEVAGDATASTSWINGTGAGSATGPANWAIDGDLSTEWDAGQPDGQWQETWTGEVSFDTVEIAVTNTTPATQTYTVYALTENTWTQVGTAAVYQAGNAPTITYATIPVTAGKYSGLRITETSSSAWYTLGEVSVATTGAVPSTVTGGGAVCTPAPAPLAGCTVTGVTTASVARAGNPAGSANDGNLTTYWDAAGPIGTWQVTFTDPSSLQQVNLGFADDASGVYTMAIYGLSGGTWTEIGSESVTRTANATYYTTIPVTAGTYDGIKVAFNDPYIWAELSEVAVS